MKNELKVFSADLHIHTCLSPCADLEMSPQNIVREAIKKGIEIIAITDHNCTKNVKGVFEAAKGTNLKIFYGIEITTKEEVHLLAYFPSLKKINCFNNFVEKNIDKTNDRKVFDEQIIANGKDEILGFCKYNLFSAVKKSIGFIVEEIHLLGGLAIPAHIDREGFGIIGQLGFFPENIKFDGVECYDRNSSLISDILKKYGSLTSSDAHKLEEIGKRKTMLKIKEPLFNEFVKALNFKDGREIV